MQNGAAVAADASARRASAFVARVGNLAADGEWQLNRAKSKASEWKILRLSSLIFAYLRLMGEKLLRALRAAAADWGGARLRQQNFSSATTQYTRYTYFIYDNDS